MSERHSSPSLLGVIARSLGHRLLPRLVRDLDSGERKAIRRDLAAAAGDDPAVFDTVEPVYERLLAEATGGHSDAPAVIRPTWTPGERAVFSTRYVVDEFDSVGPVGLLAPDVRPVLDEALAGFRLLGLEEHAATVAKLLASGFDADTSDDDPEVLDFAEDWYNIEDAEPVRASYIEAHPQEFRS